MSYVKQVGGDHYETGEEDKQHWDFMERYDIAYLEATATKYMGRAHKKGTMKLDVGKGISYLEKVLTVRSEVRRTMPLDAAQEYVTLNAIPEPMADWTVDVLAGGGNTDLRRVIASMKDFERQL